MAENEGLSSGTSCRAVHQSSLYSSSALLETVKEIIPPLLETAHKGEAGSIGVIGGSLEYTGSPYFAGISALKTGADLAHVFCTTDSATVIKSYSPELIVHPLLDRKHAVNEISEWLPKLHSLVIGPGLGWDPINLDNTKTIMEKAIKQGKQLVIDAEGLHIVTLYPDIIKNYTKAILTPNVAEFARHYHAVMGQSLDPNGDIQKQVEELSKALGHVTICRKGQTDVISDGHHVVLGAVPGSNRRCGGQGDFFSGVMGTFVYWAHNWKEKNKSEGNCSPFSPTILAAYAASSLTRTCNALAFAKMKRSTTTSDMITEIQVAFEMLFGSTDNNE